MKILQFVGLLLFAFAALTVAIAFLGLLVAFWAQLITDIRNKDWWWLK